MKRKNIQKTAAAVLGAAAILHGLRLVAGWSLVINGWYAPAWLSVAAFVIAGTLAVLLYKQAK